MTDYKLFQREAGVVDQLVMGHYLTGHYEPVIHIVTYPNVGAAPTVEHITSRLAKLCQLCPILCARLNLDTEPPSWVSGGREPEIRCQTFKQLAEDTTESLQYQFSMTIRRRGTEIQLDQGPYVLLDLHLPSNPSKPAFLAYSCDHTLADGLGGLRLLELMAGSESLLHLKPEHGDVMLTEDILDRTIRAQSAPELPPRAWPVKHISPTDPRAHETYTFTSIPATVLPSLHATRKAHAVTLEPVLEIAYTIALWHIVGRPAIDFTSVTVVSDRQRCGSRAAVWSGNYFSVLSTSTAPAGDTPFWPTVARRGAFLHDPALIESVRQTTVRDAAHHASIAKAAKESLLARQTFPHRYSCSIGFSNLMRQTLLPGATDHVWFCQLSPYLGALPLYFVGHEGGLRMVQATWAGAALRDEAEVKAVGELFSRILAVLPDLENPTYRDILEAVVVDGAGEA